MVCGFFVEEELQKSDRTGENSAKQAGNFADGFLFAGVLCFPVLFSRVEIK
jgi:hypothetical protein